MNVESINPLHMDIDEINRMRSFGAILDQTYQSPDIKDIKKLLRIREINNLGKETKSSSVKNLLKHKKISNFISQ